MKNWFLILFLFSYLNVFGATASGEHVWATGETITASLMNLNVSILKASVNSVASSQITDDTIVNSDINSAAGIEMSKITGTPSDALLSDALENKIDGCWIYRVDDDTCGVTVGSIMVNGELRRNTSADTGDPTTLDALDWTDVWTLADSAASTFTISYVDSGATPGGSANPGTNGRMIGSIKWDASQDLNVVINYRDNYIIGWDWQVGDATDNMTRAITFGKTFDFDPDVSTNFFGRATDPADRDSFSDALTVIHNVTPHTPTTTGATALYTIDNTSTFGNSKNYAYVWRAYGRYS